MLIGRTASAACCCSCTSPTTAPKALPRRRLEVLGTRGQLVAERHHGPDAGRHRAPASTAAIGESTPAAGRRTPTPRPSPGRSPPSAAPAARRGRPLALPLERDLGRMRLLARAYGTEQTAAHAADALRLRQLRPLADASSPPPPDCPVCTDTRNDLPEDGWHFRPVEEVRRDAARPLAPARRATWSPSPPRRRFGLNGTGWLLLHPDGNVAFEAAPFYTDDMLAEIERLGGIRFLAASHVPRLRRAVAAAGRVPAGGAGDPEGRPRMTKAFRVTWPYDDALELPPRPDAAPRRRPLRRPGGAARRAPPHPVLRRRLQGGPGRGAARTSPSPPTRPSTNPSRSRPSEVGALPRA